jgi:hypothetical protein
MVTCVHTSIYNGVFHLGSTIVAATKITGAWLALTVSEGSKKKIHCENNL